MCSCVTREKDESEIRRFWRQNSHINVNVRAYSERSGRARSGNLARCNESDHVTIRAIRVAKQVASNRVHLECD